MPDEDSGKHNDDHDESESDAQRPNTCLFYQGKEQRDLISNNRVHLDLRFALQIQSFCSSPIMMM